MEKGFAIVAILMFLSFMSCKNSGEKIISKIESECKVSGEKDKLGDGSEFYSYSLSGLSAYAIKGKVKGIIDKQLDILPSEVKEGQISSDGHIYDNYKWETPSIMVTMEFSVDGDRSKLKLWILNK